MDIKATRPSMISNSNSVTQVITNAPSGASGPNVNFNVFPSAGLNEEQIGESAMEHLYWKLSNTI
jgi:hypothetical protein